jgi:hypothetical protein
MICDEDTEAGMPKQIDPNAETQELTAIIFEDLMSEEDELSLFVMRYFIPQDEAIIRTSAA